ncbi:TetR family transcriptional regulator [Nocardia sp. NPDC050406]|uniref:TetR family transcriptional regulator n=1 Tax=Nocardia sp. NPDC050406 TaxID=3364318 RepID=UPI0037985412
MAAGRARPGISARQRRVERRTALLAAARELIDSQGRAGLTVAELCRRAGVTETQFHAEFADLDALVAAVAEAAAFPEGFAAELRRGDRGLT